MGQISLFQFLYVLFKFRIIKITAKNIVNFFKTKKFFLSKSFNLKNINGSKDKVIIIKLYPYLNIGNFKNQIIVQNNEKENNIKV